MHFRGGYITGKYYGPQDGGFEVPNALDLEYEVALSSQRSVIMRSMIAMQLETSKVLYTYSGSGMRYYFASKGMQVETEDEHVAFSSIPKWRYYWGWDAGVSTVVVQSLGKVLQVSSTMVDIGVNLGTAYQIDRKFAVELHTGVTNGQGFSSVSVFGYSIRVFGGMIYHF